MLNSNSSSRNDGNTNVVRSLHVKTIQDVIGTEDMVEVGQQIIYNKKQYTLSEVELLDTGSVAWLLPDGGESFSVNANECFLANEFILGYNADDDISPDLEPEKLRQYSSIKEADYESEEWCVVYALTLEDAKQKYEETFQKYKSEGRINGCM